ncbi:MAG: RluA family pseudouridine synthase [Alphaproteobacteria bacterium]|nr:RluA family pseudouridine synthase [Alphaproteobacteria bacterium]
MTADIRAINITEPWAGQRLDKALAALAVTYDVPLSRARLQALMGAGHITIDGVPVTDASRKTKLGETYRIALPPPEKAEPEAQAIALNIVFEDKDVIVIDKPPGLVVHPAPGNPDNTLVNALLAHCGNSLSGIGGVARPGIVHRLDKDTSGLMVVAKTDAAHQKLSAQFADRSLSRTYQAVVWGVPVQPSGSIDAPIGRSMKDRKKMAVTAKGREALTHYKVIENYTVASLVECKLATGRTHQIRVHMAHLKHPVVGDAAYGGRTVRAKNADMLVKFPRQALHAVGLQFIHPRSGKIVKFASKLPEDIAALIKKMRAAGFS